MGIQNRKIGTWQHPVVDELDKPTRLASEMKTVFDSNSNELKTALNGLIDDIEGGEPAVTFTEAESRANIATGEQHKTMFGKIKKFFSDLAAVAFSASYSDLVDTPIPSNGVSGQVLRCKTSGSLDLEWAYGSGSVDQIQADFYEESETSKAYVRNRPILANDVSVAVAAFELDSDNTHTAYPYKALAPVTGALASMSAAYVTFSEEDRVLFAGTCTLADGGVTVYATRAPSAAVTIPNIIIWR